MADEQLDSEVGSSSRRDELAHKCALCLQAIKELEDDISDQRTNLIEYKLEIRGMDRRSRGESLDTDDQLEPRVVSKAETDQLALRRELENREKQLADREAAISQAEQRIIHDEQREKTTSTN